MPSAPSTTSRIYSGDLKTSNSSVRMYGSPWVWWRRDRCAPGKRKRRSQGRSYRKHSSKKSLKSPHQRLSRGTASGARHGTDGKWSKCSRKEPSSCLWTAFSDPMTRYIRTGCGEGIIMKKEIALTLNNEERKIEVDPGWTLLYALREILELTGTKEGCGYG